MNNGSGVEKPLSSGGGGRRFKSYHSDQAKSKTYRKRRRRVSLTIDKITPKALRVFVVMGPSNYPVTVHTQRHFAIKEHVRDVETWPETPSDDMQREIWKRERKLGYRCVPAILTVSL